MRRNWITATLFLAILGLSASAAASDTPTATASAGGTLDLEAALSHPYVPAKSAQTVHARIQVRADDVRSAKRAPMNLAVVIDHSGSMSGGRLDQAKRAAHTLVDRLSEQDRLAVVSYGNNVSVDFHSVFVTPANQERLHQAINSIRIGGSTNLAGGFTKGAQIVGEHGTDTSINRVILLSDGKANIGAQTPEDLGKMAAKQLGRGVSATTMGIGLDYNERLMAEIAKQGAGHYYFVENEKKLAEIFQEEFKTLSQAVARKTKLEITVGDGVELVALHGYPHKTRGDKVTVPLDTFYARQHKDIMLDLSVSARGAGARDIVSARLEFADVTKDDKVVHSEAKLAALATDDSKKLAKVEKSVMRRAEQINYAKNVEAATDAYERGEREKADKILSAQQKRLEKAAKSYDFDEEKVASKVKDIEEKKAKMKRSKSSRSSSGKRLKKRSRKDALDLMQSSEAW